LEFVMKVSQLQPGVVIAQAVRDVNGRLLMGEGTRLTERFIGVLKAWGVPEVAIVGEQSCHLPDEEDAFSEDAAALARDVAKAKLCLNCLDHPFVQDVFLLAVASLTEAIKQGGSFTLPPESAAPVTVPPLPPLDLEALAASNKIGGAMPGMLARLAEAMETPSASPVEVAEIIQNDPGLTAKLLKVANSALYGFPQRIDTISRAVTVIGVQQLSALALGVTVMGLFKKIPKEFLDIRKYWRHCLACACGSRALASSLGLPNTERFFVAGLLHDVGLLLFILRAPDRVRLVLSILQNSREPISVAERRVMGASHGAAGATLLASWGLPESLSSAAAWHHEPSQGVVPRDVAIVHAADFLTDAMGYGTGGQAALMPLDEAAFALLNAPPGVAHQVAARITDQLGQLESIFMHNV
jgi:putative nucleotidyltransferase with HDIG domain